MEVRTQSVLVADAVDGAAHESLLAEAIGAHNGTMVERGHDHAAMATFASSADAVGAAVALQQAGHEHDVELRVGVSVGDVGTEQDGVIVGGAVVEASRLCAAAQPTEILTAQTVRELSLGRGGFAYEPMGNLVLGDLPDPVAACRVQWEPLPGPTATVPFPRALAGGFTTTYVGRGALLDSAGAMWRQAQAGAPGALLLAGEPGVGKTRTAGEVGRAARADGALVLYGRCDEDLGAPYQPFVEALEWYSAQDPVGTLGRMPGELVRLLPALGDRVSDLPAPVASDPSSERHQLFEATASWLIDASRDTGLLLVIDDVHWATKPTLLLMQHVLRAASEAAAPVLMLITYRDTEVDRAHPLSTFLGDVRSLASVERASVDNLTEPEVVALMEASAGHEMGEDGRTLGAAVFAETEGNPFFVSEVLRHLIETGAIRRTDDRWLATTDIGALTIPEGVRDVVGRRLSRLSPAANRVLSLASVQGRDADVDVLVALSDDDEMTVLDGLDEAVRARLVEETGVGRFRFSHALVRATLYEELSAARRRRLHRRISDVLEKLRVDDVVALAYHCAEGGPDGGDFGRAVHYGLAAAEQSLAARAFADAEDRFVAVLELLDDSGGLLDPRQRVAALCGLGECQRDQGDAGFRETLLDASRQAVDAGATDLLVRAVIANSRGMASIIGAVDDERIALIEAALEAVGPEPSADRARVLAQLSAEVTFGGDHPRRLALSDEAEAMARLVDDKEVLAWVLVRTGYSSVVPSRWERWLERGAEAVLLADTTGDPTLRVLARIFHYGALLFNAQIDDAFEVCDEMIAIADAECSPATRWLAHVNALSSTLAREGAVAAGARNDAILAMGQDANQSDALQWWGSAASSTFWLLGEGGDVADTAGMFAAQFPGLRVWYTGYAWMLCEGDRHDEARAVIEAQGLRYDPVEDSSLPLTGTHQLAAVAWELDDAEMAAALIPALEKYVGHWSHYFLVPIGPVGWGLGAALSVLGEYDRAIPLVEDAVVELVEHGFRDHAVHCRIHLARILRKADRPGDADRAREVLLEARAHAETVPAPRMVARIDALLA